MSNIDVLKTQAKLAHKFGIHGFCIYHYWFEGKKLLEKPLEMLLEHKDIDLPFCICWANETWARTWDGDNKAPLNTILIKQNYGKEKEWEKHFEYLNDFFQDKRYIRVDEKPVILIYRAENIPQYNKMIACWNKMALEQGLPGLYVLQMNTGFGYQKRKNLSNGIVDYEPMRTLKEWDEKRGLLNKRREFVKNLIKNPILKKMLSIRVLNYSRFHNIILENAVKSETPHFYCSFPGWDNSPRKTAATIFIGSTPRKFHYYFDCLYKKSMDAGNSFVFINAWNEWGEGAYLEPDTKCEYKYLESIKKVVNKNRKSL